MDILWRLRDWGLAYTGNIVDGLCITCREIFRDPSEPYGRKLQDNYMEGVVRASKAGCGICRLFLDTLDPEADLKRLVAEAPRDTETKVDPESEPLIREEPWRFRMEISEGGMCRVETSSTMTLMSLVFQPSVDFGSTLFHKKIPPQVGSYRSEAVAKETTDALPLARWWLERCEESHEICNATRRASLSTPPTRLLRVTGDEVCLKLGETFGPNPRYATLSHKWGTLRILTLESGNIERFRQGIPHRDLCKTFQDAVCITKALGLDYLWIDSLCIVQNDLQDWAREATIMCNIYGGSAITIAAASAEDGSVGCFFERDPNFKAKYKFSGRGGKEFILAKEGVYESCFEDNPLASRAWAFQERHLSPRILYMFSKQVCWECKEARACESYPDGIPMIIEKERGSDLRANELSKGVLSKGNALPSWGSIVSHYTSKKLTYGKDKLPALAGVARKYQEVMGFGEGEYVAGLWRKGLEEQLLWRADREGRPSFRAPSWSWANVDCGVDICDPALKDSEYFISVIGVIGLPLGAAAFGEIESGMLEVACESLIHAREGRFGVGSLYRYFYQIPSPSLAQEEDPGRLWTLTPYLDARYYGFYDLDGTDDRYILPIRPDYSSAIGLILERTGQDKGVYRRLGMFTLPEPQRWEDIMVPPEAEDCIRVVEGKVKRRFIIHII